MNSVSSRVLGIAFFDSYRSLYTWRWLAVPPVFMVGGWLGADHADFIMTVLNRSTRQPNFWDGALILPTNKLALVFAFVLGFVLVIGDLYVRDHSQGTAHLTLLRSGSRAAWWAGKILSLASPALLYSGLAYLFALLGSALRLPVTLGTSGAAEIPWGGERAALYPRFGDIPMPLFFLLVIVYTAFALWAVGSTVLAVSALYPRMVVPLAAGLALVLIGSGLREPFFYERGAALFNPVYHVTYVSSFAVGKGLQLAPLLWAVTVLGCTLLLAFGGGMLWVRRTDL